MKKGTLLLMSAVLLLAGCKDKKEAATVQPLPVKTVAATAQPAASTPRSAAL